MQTRFFDRFVFAILVVQGIVRHGGGENHEGLGIKKCSHPWTAFHFFGQDPVGMVQDLHAVAGMVGFVDVHFAEAAQDEGEENVKGGDPVHHRVVQMYGSVFPPKKCVAYILLHNWNKTREL